MSESMDGGEDVLPAVIDIDTFMTIDDVDAVWINGLMVYLASKKDTVPRPLDEWREALRSYQALR